MTNTNTNTQDAVRDARIERLVRSAAHGEPDNSKEQALEDLLRAAWALMNDETRDAFMASRTAREVGSNVVHWVDHGKLRALLVNVGGANRVVVAMTHEGGRGGMPEVLSICLHSSNAGGGGAAPRVRGPSPHEAICIEGMALRLGQHLLDDLPPAADVPAWTSTIDWDLDRDMLTQSMELVETPNLHVQSTRWLGASQALDSGAAGAHIDRPADQIYVVFELEPALTSAPQWVEVCIAKAIRDTLAAGGMVELGGAVAPLWSGGGEGRAVRLEAPHLVPILHDRRTGLSATRPPTTFVLRSLSASNPHETLVGGQVQTDVFLHAAVDPLGDVLYFDRYGARVDASEETGYAMHLDWIAAYRHTRGLDLEEDEESEFDRAEPADTSLTAELPRG